MHSLEPYTRYKIVSVLLAFPADVAEPEMQDAVAETLADHMRGENPLVADWSFAGEVYERQTSGEAEEGELFHPPIRSDGLKPRPQGELPPYMGLLNYITRILQTCGDFNRDWILKRLWELRREVEIAYSDTTPPNGPTSDTDWEAGMKAGVAAAMDRIADLERELVKERARARVAQEQPV